MIENKFFGIDDKFHEIQNKLKNFVDRSEWENELKTLVIKDKFNDLDEMVK